MHWYTRSGESRHEVMGKNGKLRATTLRDARIEFLIPSVTTIMDVASKPMLINWLQDQVLNAAIAYPYHPDEYDEKCYKSKIISLSKLVGKDAADRGNRVHAILDRFFMSREAESIDDIKYISKVKCLLDTTFGTDVDWVSEKSFAHRSGFGGRVDLYSPSHNLVIDFKTKDKEDIASVVAYDEYKMQLVAYQEGLDLPPETRRFNLFISVAPGHEGKCILVEHKQSEYEQHMEMFYSLLYYWQAKNKYDSSFGD